tara:strand:+ start:663 stop:1091 length:429 start_codon:yes stop_codon:yes gene_type:complete
MIFQKLRGEAVLPTRATEHSAGYDLTSLETKRLKAGEQHLFKTGITWNYGKGGKVEGEFHMGRIMPRSGLSLKKHIDVGAGLIDADYRGDIGVLLRNLGKEDAVIMQGDKIAQLVIQPYYQIEDDLHSLEQRNGGWGSTDAN